MLDPEGGMMRLIASLRGAVSLSDHPKPFTPRRENIVLTPRLLSPREIVRLTSQNDGADIGVDAP